MVNAAKRMRALSDKLYGMRFGPGSTTIPPSPAPQIKSIYIRIPTGSTIEVAPTKKDDPNASREKQRPPKTPFTHILGARNFCRAHLQSLKYYNPSIAVDVETIGGPEAWKKPSYMSIVYEASTREALQNIDASFKDYFRHHQISHEAVKKDRVRLQEKLQNFRRKVIGAYTKQRDLEAIAEAPKDEITALPQPPIDPSSPQTTAPSGLASSPAALYTRTVTLPLMLMAPGTIWYWIQQHYLKSQPLQYKIRKVPEDEFKEHKELRLFNKNAQKDRERVKTGIDAMRREAAELKKAREAAERMASES